MVFENQFLSLKDLIVCRFHVGFINSVFKYKVNFTSFSLYGGVEADLSTVFSLVELYSAKETTQKMFSFS